MSQTIYYSPDEQPMVPVPFAAADQGRFDRLGIDLTQASVWFFGYPAADDETTLVIRLPIEELPAIAAAINAYLKECEDEYA